MRFGKTFLYLSIQNTIKMAHTKHCNTCGKTKPTTEFSKKSASSDGLQGRCKACNKKDNLKFRTEKPEHHAKWQKVNSKRVAEIVTKYRCAKENGTIYYIQNPEGQFYVGMTKTPLKVRIMEHRTKWRRQQEGKIKSFCPLLYASFEKWGFDSHTIGTILEFDNISKRDLRECEKEVISTFKALGISLNKQI